MSNLHTLFGSEEKKKLRCKMTACVVIVEVVLRVKVTKYIQNIWESRGENTFIVNNGQKAFNSRNLSNPPLG